MVGTDYLIRTPCAMLDSLQRLLKRPLQVPLRGRQSPSDPESTLICDWARQRGDEFKRVRRGPGAVVRAQGQVGPMRIEWGPSQRHYIRGHEMRVRIDAHLPEPMEMLVMSRGLAESLEAQTFQQLTSLQQTEIGDSMPEEGRWLSMFERIEVDAAPPTFAQNFVVVSSCVPHARHWAAGELAVRLMRARAQWLAPHAPLVLMTMRGRLYLRTEAGTFDETLLDGVRMLADAAALRARKISTRAGRAASAEALAAQTAHVAQLRQSVLGGRALATGLAAAPVSEAASGAAQAAPLAPSGPQHDPIEGMAAHTLPGLDFDEFNDADDADLPNELPPLGEPVPTDLQL